MKRMIYYAALSSAVVGMTVCLLLCLVAVSSAKPMSPGKMCTPGTCSAFTELDALNEIIEDTSQGKLNYRIHAEKKF